MTEIRQQAGLAGRAEGEVVDANALFLKGHPGTEIGDGSVRGEGRKESRLESRLIDLIEPLKDKTLGLAGEIRGVPQSHPFIQNIIRFDDGQRTVSQRIADADHVEIQR